jgi:hypothetical protein
MTAPVAPAVTDPAEAADAAGPAAAAIRLARERRGDQVRVVRPGAAAARLPSLERPRRAH